MLSVLLLYTSLSFLTIHSSYLFLLVFVLSLLLNVSFTKTIENAGLFFQKTCCDILLIVAIYIYKVQVNK